MQRVPSHDANGSGARLAAVVNARRTWGLLMFPNRDREGVVPSAHHCLSRTKRCISSVDLGSIVRGGRYLSIPLAPALSARSVYSRRCVRAGRRLVLAGQDEALPTLVSTGIQRKGKSSLYRRLTIILNFGVTRRRLTQL